MTLQLVCRLAFATVICSVSSLALAKSPESARRVIDGKTLGARAPSCFLFENLSNTIIQNLTVGPCPADGIKLVGARNVTIRNVTINGTGKAGIYVLESDNVDIEESEISDAVTGISVFLSSNVRVNCNTIEDVRGPVPAGQFVQFSNVTGAGNRISCNIGRNNPSLHPEDAISLFQSQGTNASPISIDNNLIIGGGPSHSGGGIMLGDNGGMFQTARNNILVDPGQYGIGVASGSGMVILRNLIFARRSAWTNTGLYVWNQYPHACTNITVRRNRVNWTNSAGAQNPFWDGRNCGILRGLSTNTFPATIGPRIKHRTSSECLCQRAGRVPSTTTTAVAAEVDLE